MTDRTLVHLGQGCFCLYTIFFVLEANGLRLFGSSSTPAYNTLFWISIWMLIGALLVHLHRGFGGWSLFLFGVGTGASAFLMVRLMM